MSKLSAVQVARLKKPGKYYDGKGLALQINKRGGKSWIFRFMVRGRERALGLGPLDLVSLAEAREKAREARKALKLDGIDPIEARRQARQAAALEAARGVTFEDCAGRYIAAHQDGWRNPVHRAQWKSTLETYAYPHIGSLPVAEVDTGLVLRVLEPLWHQKPETATRLRGRIERVLDWAAVRGYRQGDNPARWKGHLAQLLPSRRKIRAVRHHPALPYAELPAFVAKLRVRPGISALALEFVILNASRTGEAIGATWDEIDQAERLWRIPADRMKANKPHTVPLSDGALALLGRLPRVEGCPYLFPGAVEGKSLSNMALLELMREMAPDYVPHGFRSTFRDWAAECTSHPAWVAEAALAHIVADKVEAAYRRGELLEKRRALMADWARFCGGSHA